MTRDEERAIEWDCQKARHQYYHHVDHREYEKAVAMFTPDVEWEGMAGLTINSHEAMLEALQAALGSDTIRHILTNTVVTVIDENHAEARSYHTLYYTAGIRVEDHDGPLAFEGPHRTHDVYTELVRTDDGWKVAKLRSQMIFRRDPDEPVTLEKYAAEKSKLAPSF